ncbi:MAG: DUF1580 domain-containing protein [bacterium]|nr:DUF1580 domain-containing protein [bacterium]
MDTPQLIPIGKARKYIPSRPDLSTIYRWITNGVHGGVKLEVAKCGGRTFTTREAIADFIDRCTKACMTPDVKRRSARKRRTEHSKACAKLATERQKRRKFRNVPGNGLVV